MNRSSDPPADAASITTLFSDIEGSTRLWEQRPDEMRAALAAHDAIARACVAQHRGTVVKTTGDGIHAVFGDAVDAVAAMVDLLRGIADPASTAGLPLKVRLGAHCGADELRGGDYYGRDVNRAARIMSVAHGGQMLVSQAVAARVGERWPPGTSARDLGLVRLRDLAEPQRLYQVLHPALRADFPALRSLEATPNNLPQQLNRFIGRERESAEVRSLLRTNRLVTLLGLGGLGKSRLSVQLAAELLDDHPDGVWFVELAPVADERLVPHAVAGVLGVQEEPGVPLAEALTRTLRDRRLLVVLDNCEHVVHACADLAKRLLQAVPGLTILATSREALRIAGEACYALPALSAPPVAGAVPGGRATVLSAEALLDLDAVRLFVDRAQAAQRAFRLDASTAPAVAEICAQLDGIPLALELAAARVRTLSVDAIAERIGDRFRLLKTTDQTVLPRQRTLRALIDWSYDLLSEPERALFARLSVFAGGWTLGAAEAVGPGGDGDPIGRDDVLDLLASLVEKSLVAMDADGGRYRYLETVRAYAAERLGEGLPASGEPVLRRHAEHFVTLAERARAEMSGPDQVRWLALLDVERENLLAAHRNTGTLAGGAELALRLVAAQRVYWIHRGLAQLGQGLCEQLLQRTGQLSGSAERARAQAYAGQMHYFGGQLAEARQHLEGALAAARELGDREIQAGILQPLGMTCLGLRDDDAADRYLTQALDLARTMDDPVELAAALNALAMLRRTNGEVVAARPLLEEALALARQVQDTANAAILQLNLAMVEINASDVTAPIGERLIEAIRAARALNSIQIGVAALEVAAGWSAVQQEPARSGRWLAAAESHSTAAGIIREPADDRFIQPLAGAARAAIGDQAYTLAYSGGAQLGYAQALDEVMSAAALSAC
jgi:predicted ATPase/class 3 adenylate cyclase